MARYIDVEAFKQKLIDEKSFFPAIVARALDEMPTADVVLKSEVEKIFAEIEKEIDTGLSVIEKILNAKGGRANGKTVLISKYDVFIEAKKHLTKLKKKYTEEI